MKRAHRFLRSSAAAKSTVAAIAERTNISFRLKTFLKVGCPMMLVSIAIGMVYIRLRYYL